MGIYHVLWRKMQAADPFWKDTLKESDLVLRALNFGVYEKPASDRLPALTSSYNR